MARALFLDRDGVVNHEIGYLHRSEDVRWVDGIFSLCRTARALGYKLIVVTNQAGIARGYYTMNDFDGLTAWMNAEMEREDAAPDAVYCCPYHPVHGIGEYKREHEDRKPGTGMLRRGAREFGLDLGESIMVGDRCSDVGAANAAGLRQMFLIRGTETECGGDFVEVGQLAEVERWIVGAGVAMSYVVETSNGWGELFRFRRDPLAYVGDRGRRSVDVHCMRFGQRQLFHINQPELIRDVLITHDWNFIKGRGLRSSKPILGSGLLTSEGEVHRRQRRLVQPAFHSARLASYAQTMVQCAAEMSEGWAAGQTGWLDQEMMRLTLHIVGKTLFGADLRDDVAGVRERLKESLRLFVELNNPLVQATGFLRKWIVKKAERSRLGIEQVLHKVVEDHRRNPEQYDDMLTMLMQHDAATGYMSDNLLLDEVLTLFLAGHETTANALTWTWYVLAQRPDIEARMHAELQQVLNGRLPEMEDLPRLQYTGWVFLETLRLYPPAWMFSREAVTPYHLGEIEVPAGGTILMSPYATQRDPRFWPEPEKFLPERWGDDASSRPKFAFFPFGAGMRVCIGEHFARMEGVLLIATLAQRWRLRLLPQQEIYPRPRLTLRPNRSIQFQPEPVV